MEQEQITTNENIELNENNFLSSINEELRNEPSLKDFKDINGLAKSYINISKMIGKSDIPNDKSTSEDWNKFYTKLGRPESFEKYVLEKDYSEYDNDFLNGIKQVCFDNGITNKQLNSIISKYSELENLQEENYLNSLKEQEVNFINNFNKEFGNRAEEVKQNVRKFVEQNVNEQDKEILNNLNDEKTIIVLARLFDSIYKKNSEGSIRETTSVNSGMSLNDIVKKMKEMREKNPFCYDTKEYQQLETEKQQRYLLGERIISNE